jgi:crotonobetainyl-CoA:carnitine CoA-transferase CaiB-like acyl-CoA transferase
MTSPLAGIRIVDLTTAVVGPYASQILADFGADVIKIEEKGGDVMRWIAGPSPSPGMSGKFLHLNRNKRSISLDLKTAAGREVIGRLIGTADVFMHNMRPAAIARLGLGGSDVAAINPTAIYCAIVGFGQKGHLKDRPAYDSILQGGTGLASLAGRGGEPAFVPYVVVDRTAGLMVVNAIMTALFDRERNGTVRSIEIPMFESFVALLLSEHLYARTFEPALGGVGDLRLLDPEAKPVRTRDGHVCITTNTDRQVMALFDAIGRPELKGDSRFNTGPARIRHIAEFFRIRADAMLARDTADWMEDFARREIPAMAVASLDDLLAEGYLEDVGLIERAQHPSEGVIWSIGVPTRMSGFTPSLDRHAPQIGQDSADLLRELSYSDDAIDALLRGGVAFDASPASVSARAPAPVAVPEADVR